MNRQEKLEFLINAIQKVTSTKSTITEETMLDSVGLDSLDIVELQLYYEDVTGYETKDPTLPVLTVKDLIDLMP